MQAAAGKETTTPLKRLWMAAVVLSLALLSLGLLLMTYRITEEKRQNFVITDTIHELQLQIASSHLWLDHAMNEYASLYAPVELGKVWETIDSSIKLTGAMLHGGTSAHGKRVTPLRGEALRRQVQRLRADIVAYADAARHKYFGGLVTSAADQRFDLLFKSVMSDAAALDNIFEAQQSRHEAHTKLLLWSILFPWLVVTTISVSALWKRELKRRQAEILERAHAELELRIAERTRELVDANQELREQYRKRQQAEVKCRQSYEVQQVITRLISTSLEPVALEEQLRQALELLCSLSWLKMVKMGGIFLAEETAELLFLKAARGFDEERLRRCCRVPFDHCLCGRAARTREVRFVGGQTAGTPGEGREVHGHYLIPILSGDHLLGVINLYVAVDRPREPDIERFLVSVAQTLAGVIERERSAEEARTREGQLIQADKMASLGTMVAGVSHEINNPNNFILSNAQMIQEIYQDAATLLDRQGGSEAGPVLAGLTLAEVREVVPKLLDGIIDGARRIKSTVDELGDFARPEIGTEAEALDINQVITAALAIIASQVKERAAQLSYDLAPALPPVRGGRQKLGQVFINLVMNALQALPQGGGAVRVASRFEARQGVVAVGVEDEGEGIAAQDLKRVMEPFFTTKAARGGTGLGLSVSYAIVKEHRGTIHFDSTPGKGTRVTVRLPAAEEEGGPNLGRQAP